MKKRSRKKRIALAFGILLIIVAIVAIYFTFFFSYKCDDISCFRAHQEKCSRTKFTNNLEDATWNYQIRGERSGECKIEVNLIRVKQGTTDKQKLEGKSMDCFLPFGDISYPEGNIRRCTGELKEELQDRIIQKLHSYILENINEIGTELSVFGTNSLENKTNVTL